MLKGSISFIVNFISNARLKQKYFLIIVNTQQCCLMWVIVVCKSPKMQRGSYSISIPLHLSWTLWCNLRFKAKQKWHSFPICESLLQICNRVFWQCSHSPASFGSSIEPVIISCSHCSQTWDDRTPSKTDTWQST